VTEIFYNSDVTNVENLFVLLEMFHTYQHRSAICSRKRVSQSSYILWMLPTCFKHIWTSLCAII